ncbi:MAG TPA: hypothetical protein VF637_18905 [Sphingomicrobium sp.]
MKSAGLCLSAWVLLTAAPATAQATRTWVSGLGDDVNPCSRTSPCKTFAGAISKTAAGGEINCMDPGGFGSVTITKAMTISCPYTEGGVLAGGNGITINAGPNDVVFLRGLDFFGVSPPSSGVRFIAGAALHIDDCVIRRFNGPASFGISFQPGTAALLTVSNSIVADNGQAASGGGILIKPTGAAGAKVLIRNVAVKGNLNVALQVDTTGNSGAGASVVVADSDLAGSTTGLRAVAQGTPPARVLLSNTTIAHNSVAGIAASGSGASVEVAGGLNFGNGNATVKDGGARIQAHRPAAY